MKTITTLNWVLIGLYGALLVFSLFQLNRPGNDAAGRGMESGFVVFGFILLAGLVGLNLWNHRAAKITALAVAALPLVMLLYNHVSDYLIARHRRNQDIGQSSQPLPPNDPSDPNHSPTSR
ncbi:hypothetical protein [Spirosoma koreense]